MNNARPTPRWPFAVTLSLILLIAAALRLYRLPELPLGLHYDEAANVVLTGEIARGVSTPIFISSYTGKEALFFYWAALWMKWLGATPFALRFSAALVGIATVAATAWAVRELLHGRRDADYVALLTAAFLAVSFWHLIFSRYGFRAVTQPLMQALTVAMLWRGVRFPLTPPLLPSPFPRVRGKGEGTGVGKGGCLWLLLAGLCCGLTAYTYLAARAFPIPLAATWLALLLTDRGHWRARLVQLAVFAAAAALALVPLAWYWWTHPGSFLTRIQQVGATDWADAWAGIRACLGMFFLRGDPYIRFNLPHRPLFDPVTAILFLAGVVATISFKGKAAKQQSSENPSSCLRVSTSPCLLATCVFLLASLPAMLLPSALATGDVTPSNLRAIGLLPFVYVFPALGLSAFQSLIAYRISHIAYRKSAGLFIVHCSLSIVLFTALLLTTAVAYFRDWAPSAALYYAADGDLVDVARYLNTTGPTDATVYVASIHYRHPTLAALARDYGRIQWLTGGRTVVFPASGEALLIVPRSASDDLAWIESVVPTNSLITAPPGPDGAPAFHAYRIAARPALSPTHPLTANLANTVYLLGYDVVGEPRAGTSADMAVWWRVEATPDHGDYGPVARLTDAWGFVWGETSPFHYPAEQWTPDETVVDHLTMPVAPGAPPGEYFVRFGLYSAQANAMLNVLDTAGRYAGTYVELPLYVSRADKPPDAGNLGIRTRLDIHASGLTLLGTNLDTASARPGERLYLTLFWQADEAPLPDHEISLILGNVLLYQGAPVHDTYPTSAWTTGEIVADRHGPRLPRAILPGNYSLQVQIADQTVDLGNVTVQAVNRAFDMPPISHPLTATLGSQVELLGYDLSAETVAPGGTLTLTLYWRALAEIDTSYTVFTHLVAVDGTMTGQQDSPPVGGAYPTTLWVAGEVVVDTYAISVRADAAPGEHRLEVGMYVAETGARLAIEDSIEDAVFLQPISVTRP